MARITPPLALAAMMALGSIAWSRQDANPKPSAEPAPPAAASSDRIVKSDREWQRVLTRDQYLVLRRRATEPPYTGRYAKGHPRGVFTCAGCDAELFSSNHKFESGTGWPSFFRPMRDAAVQRAWDYDGVEPRVEVTCARCGGHLGHVFSDGPPPTGLRFCINSAALKLKPFPTAAVKGRPSAAAPATDAAPARASTDSPAAP